MDDKTIYIKLIFTVYPHLSIGDPDNYLKKLQHKFLLDNSSISIAVKYI